MHGLNAILTSASRVAILRALYETDGPKSGRALERACGLSNRATMLALEHLVQMGVVNREIAGRAHQYTLNESSYLVAKALKPAFDAEVLFWDDLQRLIRRTVHPRPQAAVATGPLARGEAEYGGRLMLMMLFASSRERMRALAVMPRLATRVRERYAMALEHHLLDDNTMEREEYAPLWHRVEREGILLFGTLP